MVNAESTCKQLIEDIQAMLKKAHPSSATESSLGTLQKVKHLIFENCLDKNTLRSLRLLASIPKCVGEQRPFGKLQSLHLQNDVFQKTGAFSPDLPSLADFMATISPDHLLHSMLTSSGWRTASTLRTWLLSKPNHALTVRQETAFIGGQGSSFTPIQWLAAAEHRTVIASKDTQATELQEHLRWVTNDMRPFTTKPATFTLAGTCAKQLIEENATLGKYLETPSEESETKIHFSDWE